jgi:3-methylcrotonyl-CoA carboxylase alpha subunit
VELIARAGGRVERLTIERDGSTYAIRVGDREHRVDVAAVGPFVRSLVVDGESHETAVWRVADGAWQVGWRGRSHRVELVDPLTHLAEQAHGEGGRLGRQTIAAYMPGRVVSIAVAEGDVVEAGAPLVVLEAMKMQNEIQAERAGTVRKLHVAPGQAVEGGDPLLELE